MVAAPGTAGDPARAVRSREVPVSRRLSGHARRLVTLALAGLFVALVTRRAEFAGLAAPALLLLTPWRPVRSDTATVSLALDADRITEGEQATLLVRLDGVPGAGHGRSAEPGAGPASGAGDGSGTDPGSGTGPEPGDRPGGTDRLTIRARLRPGGYVTAGDAVLGPDGWFRIPFRVDHRGDHPVGTVEITLTGSWQLAEARLTVPAPVVSCYPRPARLDSLIMLSRLPTRLGEHPARVAGDGTEFAGVREFIPGDRQRRINWPATTRRGSIQLNTFTAERSQAVVIVMDVSVAVGPAGATSADLAVRAAAGTAARYLAARDRVGLIRFGSRVRWLSPAAGQRQAHRIMDLITSDADVGDSIDTVRRLPRAALPPGALILVFSPLLSIRLVETLRDLRETGFATIVVDVLTAEPQPGHGRSRRYGQLAARIWRMEQEAIRFSLRELGIPVVHWNGTTSLDEPLAPYTRRPLVTRP